MRVIKQINEAVLKKTVERCRERNIVIPTFAEQKDPDQGPRGRSRSGWPASASGTSTRSTSSASPGRTSPRRRAASSTAATGSSSRPSSPACRPASSAWSASTSRPARTRSAPPSAAWCRAWSPASSTPTTQKAVWPSTGNYCRGGAFDCALLGCKAIAILPEEMSKERFEWLREIGTDEIIATPGHRVERQGDLRQVLGAPEDARRRRLHLQPVRGVRQRALALHHDRRASSRRSSSRSASPTAAWPAYISATGSAGTIAAGDYLRTRFPHLKVVATEALQCPTLLRNGFGAHRIEGIGDKHVPWVHNVRNTDMVAAIDDEQCMSLLRLFNEEDGQRVPRRAPASSASFIEQLPLVGISGICNLVAGHQDGQVLRARRARRPGHPAHRLDGPLRARASRSCASEHGPYTRELAARALRALPRGHRHRRPAGARLLGPQAAAQPQVLHLGRAAGQDLRGARPALGARLLDRDLRPGRGVGPAHHASSTSAPACSRRSPRP